MFRVDAMERGWIHTGHEKGFIRDGPITFGEVHRPDVHEACVHHFMILDLASIRRPYLGATQISKKTLDEGTFRVLLNEDLTAEQELKFDIMEVDAVWKSRVDLLEVLVEDP